VTPREQAVAEEIRRIARDDLHARLDFGDADELAGKLDSLALLSLVVAVEDRFRVKLTEEDAERTRCLADLARLVAARASPEALP
jgi:acyl carrier protein